ncbi:LuxR C-terminal-related transcriptional regulator [Arcicella sp. LKC2W]|uniref:LuxR C-terminal-related transcriptional regulator n=1 Tax=Arcicella sp. LKC2W TaxID=2984198 RepID=UPI002B1EAC01|nr:LuxR C-terminal-related transcriptional regulator [Arcicella sp. LKC2W]MEA5459082.1 LuxR C-terminal-related transcriptional regulator [Arcicella sp. LKC2W]
MSNQFDNLLTQAKAVWTEFAKENSEQSEESLYNKESLDLLSKNSHTVIAIIGLKSYKKLYISSNVKEMFGYTAEDNPTLGVLVYVQMMTFDHALFPITAGRWYLKCLKETSFEDKVNQRIAFVGAKMRTKRGKVIRTFIQTTHLDEDKNRNPIHVVNTIQNITHLMKDEFWWMRYTYGENFSKVKYYDSATKKTYEGDILSDREKDILRLIQEGQDSNEIAETLFLSLATVHTHRRNMLARTGMKDITALLQVAISMGMI